MPQLVVVDVDSAFFFFFAGDVFFLVLSFVLFYFYPQLVLLLVLLLFRPVASITFDLPYLWRSYIGATPPPTIADQLPVLAISDDGRTFLLFIFLEGPIPRRSKSQPADAAVSDHREMSY